MMTGPIQTTVTGIVPENPDIAFSASGPSFIVFVDDVPVRVTIPTQYAEQFITRLAKGTAVIDVMRDRYKNREEAFSVHEVPEGADMRLEPAPNSPKLLTTIDTTDMPVCGNGCGCQ